MVFKNECNCVFDEELLSKAIKQECIKKNKKIKDCYRITLHNHYPTICIAHNHYYVHNLIWIAKYNNVPVDSVIHHIDFNKLNNNINNLLLMTKKEHLLLHAEEKKGKDFRSEEGKWKGINAARKVTYRGDVKKDTIIQLHNQGYTYFKIAEILHCGLNTIRRRLKEQKEYNY